MLKIIGFFLEEYKDGKIKREQITMTSIRKFQNSTMEDKNSKKFKFYIEQKPYGSKSKDSLIPILSSSENTYKSITSVFSEKMAIFDDVNVANVTSRSDFDFDILGKEQSALFVIVPDEDKIYYTLVTIILGLLYKELVKLANSTENKKCPIEIDWICDEFSNCPPLVEPSIESIISVARSRGLRYHLFIQSLSQLDNVYGKVNGKACTFYRGATKNSWIRSEKVKQGQELTIIGSCGSFYYVELPMITHLMMEEILEKLMLKNQRYMFRLLMLRHGEILMM